MLIGILIFFLYGSQPWEMYIEAKSDLVMQHVTEKGQAKEILALLDESGEEISDFKKARKKNGRKLIALNEDHAATRDDFDAVFHTSNVMLAESRERLIELQFEMKDRMTRKQWQGVFGNGE